MAYPIIRMVRRKKMKCKKKVKEVPLAILEVVLIFVFAFAFALPVASAAEAEVVIGDAEAYQGDITSTLIKINNAENVGVIDLNLSYDQLVVRVININVTGGDFDTTFSNLGHNDEDFVRIGAFQTENPGLNGTVTIANITLRAVGSYGHSSPLNISVKEFKDATPVGNAINHTITNGTFRIISPGVTPTPTPTPSNGARDGGDDGNGDGSDPTTPTPTLTPTPTEKTPAVSGEEKVEVAATPSPTLAPTVTPSATPTQTPSSTILPTTIEQNQILIIVLLVVVSVMAIIIYTAFKRRKK